TVRGLPGYWAILVPRAAASDPAGTRPPSPTTGEVACGLQGSGPPGLPGRDVFEARARAAHGLACLRIPGGVAVARARRPTDRRGCALVGRDSHPLDGGRNFVTLPHGHSFPTSIAWSHPEFPLESRPLPPSPTAHAHLPPRILAHACTGVPLGP